MTKSEDELKLLHEEIVRSVSGTSEDEIDIVLTWLQPEFQPQIPTLRIKQCLKALLEHMDEKTRYMIQEYYMTMIRTHFFTHFKDIVHWKEMMKLEKLYVSKMEFLFAGDYDSGSGSETYWINNEMILFKRLLMKHNLVFSDNYQAKLEGLILDDDLERFEQMYQWLAPACNGQEIEFNVKIINLKVDQLSKRMMQKRMDDRYLVMNTYNCFIKTFWSKFSKLLINQDDHELTTTIYQSFENNFIWYKCDEFYTDIVPSFPESRNCLLEFRSILNKDIKSVGTKVLETLYHGFVSRFLTSSLLTCEILCYYIKTVKCLKIIDPMGMCLRSLSKAVRKHLNSRPDLIKILVIGLFPFKMEEGIQLLASTDNSLVHYQKLEQFSKELGDFSMGPELPQALPWFNQQHLPRCTYTGNDEVLLQYLNWVPNPPKIKLDVEDFEDADADDDIKYVPPTDMIQVLLDILKSKRALVDDILGVLSTKFIEAEEYTLDPEWKKIMDILLNHLEVTRQGTVTSEEDDLSHLNDVEVMLKDLALSSELRTQLSKTNSPFFQRFPHIKILSKLYWRHYQNTNGKLITTSYKWNNQMKPLVQNLNKVYESLNIGRTLKFDAGSSSRVTMNLIMKSGYTKKFKVKMEQYLVLSHFQDESDQVMPVPIQHSLKSLQVLTRIPTEKLQDILSFWERHEVLVQDANEIYRVNE